MSRNILLNKRSFKPIHAVKQLKQIKGQYKAIVDYWVDDGYPEELKNILKIKPQLKTTEIPIQNLFYTYDAECISEDKLTPIYENQQRNRSQSILVEQSKQNLRRKSEIIPRKRKRNYSPFPPQKKIKEDQFQDECQTKSYEESKYPQKKNWIDEYKTLKSQIKDTPARILTCVIKDDQIYYLVEFRCLHRQNQIIRPGWYERNQLKEHHPHIVKDFESSEKFQSFISGLIN